MHPKASRRPPSCAELDVELSVALAKPHLGRGAPPWTRIGVTAAALVVSVVALAWLLIAP
jgi:hypothetical protein